MFSDEILMLSHNLGLQCQNHSIKLATAESCTGGLLSSAITACDGSSNGLREDLSPTAMKLK